MDLRRRCHKERKGGGIKGGPKKILRAETTNGLRQGGLRIGDIPLVCQMAQPHSSFAGTTVLQDVLSSLWGLLLPLPLLSPLHIQPRLIPSLHLTADSGLCAPFQVFLLCFHATRLVLAGSLLDGFEAHDTLIKELLQ